MGGVPVTARTLAAVGSVVLLTAASGSAEEPATTSGGRPSSWRVIAGPSLALPSFATTYVSRYSPPFEYVEHTSAATQTLPLDAGTGPGVLLGVERRLGRHIGLHLSAHYGEANLSGAPGQYDLSMTYTSRPPPSYEPVEVSLQRSETQPGAEGRLKTLAVALDLVAWADLGSRGRLGVVAGPAWLHTKGRAESLVYSAYHMGGHSTSFYQDYLVSFEFPANALGLDLGGFAEVDLGHPMGLRLDLSYCWGPEHDADVTLREIVNADEIVWSAELAGIQSGLAPVPVRVDPSFFRVALALTFRF
jgi:hypothetical protein